MGGPSPDPARAAALLQQAVALRRQQRMAEAADFMGQAASVAPDDPAIAFHTAQLAYERGLPAAILFERALQLSPGNPDIIRNHALACASEGQQAQAEARLEAVLQNHPGWLDGQRVLASLRWTSGDSKQFDRGYEEATRAEPHNAGLWLGWFAAIAQLRNWPAAAAVLDQAERQIGETGQTRIARAFLASESHDDTKARAAFAALSDETNDVLNLSRLRFHLRQGETEAAHTLALSLLPRPVAAQVWPYLSLIWRILGDPRAAWLDGDPPFYAVVDAGFSAAELDDLAVLLRGLHNAQKPYAEQSVRGGTQTDRSVLLRHEPLLERAREKLLAAAQTYADGLPPFDDRHPFLSRPRNTLIVGGSWSVRLGPSGHNVAHTHPMGWLSSAFYVALPDDEDMGEAPSGYFRLGVPPPELGLDLPALAEIKPERGKLVLFASTMWHDTVPFARGERLNIALDIVPLADARPERDNLTATRSS